MLILVFALCLVAGAVAKVAGEAHMLAIDLSYSHVRIMKVWIDGVRMEVTDEMGRNSHSSLAFSSSGLPLKQLVEQAPAENSTAEEVQRFLRGVKELAGRTGYGKNESILTVPSSFSEDQRQVIKAAGEAVGLKVWRIMNEPTAAAIANEVERDYLNEAQFLVFKLEDDVLDLSVMEIDSGVYEILTSVPVNLSLQAGSEREDAILEGIETALREGIDELQYNRSQVSFGIYSGDQADELRPLIELALPQIEIIEKIDPVSNTLIGSAIQAHILQKDPGETIFRCALSLEFLSLTLSVQAGRSGKLVEVVPRNTLLSTSKNATIQIEESEEQPAELLIFQGESSDPRHNFLIGSVNLTGAAPGPLLVEVKINEQYEVDEATSPGSLIVKVSNDAGFLLETSYADADWNYLSYQEIEEHIASLNTQETD